MVEASKTQTASRRRSRLRTNLALAGATTLLCLLAIEVGLRIIRSRQAPVTLDALEARRRSYEGREVSLGHVVMASDNPRLVYELIPDMRVRWWGLDVRINSSGFRDDTFTTAAPARTFRIAALGDSSTFGWKVRGEDTWPEALERVLNGPGGGARFEVMNFGVPGYNTAMERELLRARVLSFHPDVVVLQFGANDMDLPNFVKKPVNHWRLDRCYLWGFLASRRWRGSARGTRRSPSGPLGLRGVAMTRDERGLWRFTPDRRRIPPALVDMIGEENCKAAIGDIHRLCETHGIPAVFVMDPISVDTYSETCRAVHDPLFAPYAQAAREAGFAIADPSLRIREFLETHHLESRDLWVDPEELDGHPAPPRLTMMALRIAEGMLEHDMLPATVIDDGQRDALPAAFRQRAARQWERMQRGRAPRLDETAVKILPADPEREAAFLGDGWYGREENPWGAPFRWCAPRAQLRLPPFRRLVIEVGTHNPSYLGPPDHAFLIDGQPLEYTLTRRNGRAWFDLAAPGKGMREREDLVELIIRCKPAAVGEIPEHAQRPLGLQVFRIVFEPL